jgi:hypothetical protein
MNIFQVKINSLHMKNILKQNRYFEYKSKNTKLNKENNNYTQTWY